MKHTRCAKLMGLAESAGKEDPATQPPPPQAACGGRWRQGGGHVPKAQLLKCRNRGLRPCNREGARGGWQTDRQTDFLCIIVLIWFKVLHSMVLLLATIGRWYGKNIPPQPTPSQLPHGWLHPPMYNTATRVDGPCWMWFESVKTAAVKTGFASFWQCFRTIRCRFWYRTKQKQNNKMPRLLN